MKRIELRNDFEQFLIANGAYEKFVEAITFKHKFSSIDDVLNNHFETTAIHEWLIGAFTWAATGEFEFWSKLNNKWENETKDIVDIAGTITINKL